MYEVIHRLPARPGRPEVALIEVQLGSGRRVSLEAQGPICSGRAALVRSLDPIPPLTPTEALLMASALHTASDLAVELAEPPEIPDNLPDRLGDFA